LGFGKPAKMAFEKAEFAKQKSMGKLDFGSQPRASKRDKLFDLSEFANFPWVTHFGPQLPPKSKLEAALVLRHMSNDG
jgi:hypothetical protein